MKRVINILLLIALLAAPALAYADSAKLDLWLKALRNDPVQGKVMLGKSVKQIGDKEMLVDCFVKSNDVDTTQAAIEELGGVVRTKLKTVMTASLPASALDAISDREEVVMLQSSKLLTGKMNAARGFTNVDQVQAGTGLDQAYTGKNVFAGLVDDSLNWSNSDFSGRVRYLEQKTISGSSIICDDQDIVDESCNATDGGGLIHGTHVTGIFASNDDVYTGVAKDAWIGFIYNSAQDADSGGSLSTAVIDGVDSLFAEADFLDLPSVVNLSLGTSLGAHDDTSLLEEGLNELASASISVGTGKAATGNVQGRVIVNAAGNENVNPNTFGAAATVIGGIHSDIDVASNGNDASRFGLWRVVGSPGVIGNEALSYMGAVFVDVWLDPGQDANCTIEVLAYNYDPDTESPLPPTAPKDTTTDADIFLSGGPLAFDGSTDSGSNSQLQISVATTDAEPQNSKPHAVVAITLNGGTGANLEEYVYDIIIRETSGSGTCTGDMWLYPDQTIIHDFLKGIAGRGVDAGTHGAAYDFVDGDSFKTITIPGTASGVITVASYAGRGTYIDINGDTQHQDIFDSPAGGTGTVAGKVSLFSSLGPTADGRNKPDITAPGEPIISTRARGVSLSDTILGDEDHLKLEGTSMSSPHVAGVVALLMQKNNCLTLSEALTALTSTANVGTLDSKTADPKDTYGAGIVDALGAIQAIGADTSCFEGTTDDGGGGKGCFGTLVPTNPVAAGPALALMLSPLALLIWRRRRR